MGHLRQDGGAIVSIAEMEKKAILGTIRKLKGDKLMASRPAGDWEDDALPEAEGVWDYGV